MADRVSLFRAGVAGLALMRLAPDGSSAAIGVVLRALHHTLERPEPLEPFLERDPGAGYHEWALTYDQPGNPVIALEERVMVPLLDRLPPGDAIDVAAGTGRHASSLAAMGHRVLAIDASPAMLAGLRGRPGIETAVADLAALPRPAASADLVVCSLALTHVPVLEPAVRELARVVRPNGRVIVSDVHPLIVALGGQAFYRTGEGAMRFVRNHVHWTSDYLAAFKAADLAVDACHEPRLRAASGVPHFMEAPGAVEDAAGRIAFDGLPGVIVWELTQREASRSV